MKNDEEQTAIGSSDLVARLRHGLGHGGNKYALVSGSVVMDAAAERIEELETPKASNWGRR